MARRSANKVLFSRSLCLHFVNFAHSDWPRTQNVNKRADWLTLFTLVLRCSKCVVRNLCVEAIENQNLIYMMSMLVIYALEQTNNVKKYCNI